MWSIWFSSLSVHITHNAILQISVLCTKDTICTSQLSFVRALKDEYIRGIKRREMAGAM